LRRFDELGRLLTGKPIAAAPDAISFIHDLRHKLNIPNLRELGIQSAELSEIAEHGLKASSMKANPVALTKDDLIEILERAAN
jgi:alcohol dehydrogenase class IV